MGFVRAKLDIVILIRIPFSFHVVVHVITLCTVSGKCNCLCR